MTMQETLSILGPALTTGGAGLLAFDVLRGPARLLRALRHTRLLDAADQRRDGTAQSLVETRDERSSGQQTAQLAKVEVVHATTVHRAERTNARADAHERARAFQLGILGLLLVALGGLAQTVAAVLAAARR